MTSFGAKRLVGAWQLVRSYITCKDGSVSEPLGPGAAGLIVHTADGWMRAAVMASGPRRLSRGNPRTDPVEERVAAFDMYLGYFSRCRAVGRLVEQGDALSHNSPLVGTVQARWIQESFER